MNHGCAIVWFRRDMRLADNPALHAAARTGRPVVPVFIQPAGDGARWHPGYASRAWLGATLVSLDGGLRECGSRLILRMGRADSELARLARETGATDVYWNMRVEPESRDEEGCVESALREMGISIHRFGGGMLLDPLHFATQQGTPFQIFTPFWNALQRTVLHDTAFAAPGRLAAPARWPHSDTPDPVHRFPGWEPGEQGARQALADFLEETIVAYPEQREYPGERGTSRLSPHLHFGEIAAGTVWRAVRERSALDPHPGLLRGAEAFLRQLAWREFAYHLIFHYPHTPEQPLREAFRAFPWHDDPAALVRWREGETGYPIVDAGLRELRATGWMHNRVRMIAASFLVKHLLVPWQAGARHFWETLVDADLANNTFGWQWVAGCGADAAPYFRVFNPVIQGRKFDPEGTYVRTWIPELAALPNRFIHAPWEAPATERSGIAYPPPLIEHTAGRRQALFAYDSIRARTSRH